MTIRDIRLDPRYQRRGLLTELIRYFLDERNLVVQLEAVDKETSILWQKCFDSPLWVCQALGEYRNYNPSFVRFPTSVNTPFTCF